ncbi:MAG: tRNA (guanine(26)-N(2))-dimethyltransferase [Aquificaceae bacterium]
MIREGKVSLSLQVPKVVSSRMGVFYNPHMRENRDLSLLVVLALPREDLKVCDPMGASGVRLLRMLLETSKVKKAIYNDLNPKAVEFFKDLLKDHHIPEERVEVYQEDACLLFRRLRGLNYVDVDPFGSPVPFLESALLPLARYGILAVSSTDTSVLSGTYPNTCLRRYGSKPLLSTEFYHEVGIRILIKKVIEEGAKLDFALRPVLSYSYRHYLRVFFRKDIGPKKTDQILKDIGYLVYCDRCLYREGLSLESLKDTCPYCGNRLFWAGPLWLGELWDQDLLRSMWELRGVVDISKDTNKLLKTLLEEARCKGLGFYTISALAKTFKIGQPPAIERFLEVFSGVRTHFTGEGFRTEISHKEVLQRVHELLQRA